MQVNPNCKVQVEYVGLEKTPVCIADNFLLDTSDMFTQAKQNAEFGVGDNLLYPGLRAYLPKEYVMCTLSALAKSLHEIHGIPKHAKLMPLGAHYSLVNKQPNELSLPQRIPHFDSTSPYHFALLHYIGKQTHGGTGLFRHRKTGFERIHPNREKAYFQVLEEQKNELNIKTNGYCTQSNEEFELYHEIEYKPNRMVLYPGNLLHSGLIIPSQDISDDVDSGRLTANIFLDFR